MPVVDVFNTRGDKVSQTNLADSIYNIPVKSSILHEVVKMQLASSRSGSASVKNRSDIKGSGRKLFRQKGTGRARRGNIKSPLLRGGGVVFGPSPKSYAYTVPKKVRKLALKMALTDKLQESSLMIIDRLDIQTVKTKTFQQILSNLGLNNALIVTAQKDRNLYLSSRNIPSIKTLRVEGLNVYDILKFKKLIIVKDSVEAIERRLS